ncbi:DBH-like monooxygenase protein 1 isoform X1 [Ciona intestinalis]
MFKLFFLLSFGALVYGQTPTMNYSYNLSVGVNGSLFWELTNATHITMEIHVQTTGWIGFGISPNPNMVNADIYVGWVKGCTGYITDRHATADSFPPKDTQQDVELLAASETNGWTMLKFRRQLAACETTFDRPITEDTLKLIWAYGTSDPVGTDIVAGNYHGITNRGTQNFIPLQSIPISQQATVPGETLLTFDFANSGFALPAVDTYYSCRLLAFPTLSSKHHIVKIEPIITSGNELHVHHMVLYICSQQTLQTSSSLGTTTQCYTNLPTDFQTCQGVYMAWAIGGQSFYLPREAGFSIGATGDPKFAVLEIHYDNPTMRSNVVDSSGLKLTYTPNLRANDAAMIQAGRSVSGFTHLIPPGASAYKSYGECTQNCLESAMGTSINNITVFAAFLHSHLLGKAISLKHLRGTTELKPIAVDNSYDFNFQENRYFPEYRVVKPGDSLQVVCTYNSVGKTGFTWGGLGTSNEMCMAFVFYYPQLPITNCDTGPARELVVSYLGYSSPDLRYVEVLVNRNINQLSAINYEWRILK